MKELSIELLDAQKILAVVEPNLIQPEQLEIFDTIDSTNRYLLDKSNSTSGDICLAEQQTAGRGRRGRSWFSPYGCNLYLSILWQFDESAVSLTGLSIVAGIAMASALQTYGLTSVQLKWPNDVVYQQRKLAGILVEMAGEIQGPFRVVIGVGLNISMPKQVEANINQPWIDVQTAMGIKPQRNYLAGLIINALFAHLKLFQQAGLVPLLATWQGLDCLKDREINLNTHLAQLTGKALGIDEQGRLLALIDGQIQRFNSAEVSVRVAE
jgi:BirA family biotin operon repressor/biotin-[acetyl-CoA-carboxylase] ligase